MYRQKGEYTIRDNNFMKSLSYLQALTCPLFNYSFFFKPLRINKGLENREFFLRVVHYALLALEPSLFDN